MRVINIIVSNALSPVSSIDSFGIVDEQLSNDVVQNAEDFYIEKSVDLKYGSEAVRMESVKSGAFTMDDFDDYREDVGDTLEDGYNKVAGHTVSIVWSTIDNVQL